MALTSELAALALRVAVESRLTDGRRVGVSLDQTEAELEAEVGHVAIAVATKDLEDRLVSRAVLGVAALAGIVPSQRHGAAGAGEEKGLRNDEQEKAQYHQTINTWIPRRSKRVEGLRRRRNANGGFERNLETELLELEGRVGQFLIRIVEQSK